MTLSGKANLLYWWPNMVSYDIHRHFTGSMRAPPENPDKVFGTNMGPNWGRKNPGGPHGGPMNRLLNMGDVIWESDTDMCATWQFQIWSPDFDHSLYINIYIFQDKEFLVWISNIWFNKLDHYLCRWCNVAHSAPGRWMNRKLLITLCALYFVFMECN